MEETITQEKTIKINIKVCSDFDEDCKDVDPVRCFLGGDWECVNGIKAYVDLADGICPMMEKMKCLKNTSVREEGNSLKLLD